MDVIFVRADVSFGAIIVTYFPIIREHTGRLLGWIFVILPMTGIQDIGGVVIFKENLHNGGGRFDFSE